MRSSGHYRALVLLLGAFTAHAAAAASPPQPPASRLVVSAPQPGRPRSLDASDCELLRQIKAGLLPALSEHVIGYHLTCQAPPTESPKFSLSVQAMTPAPAGDTRLASTRRPS